MNVNRQKYDRFNFSTIISGFACGTRPTSSMCFNTYGESQFCRWRGKTVQSEFHFMQCASVYALSITFADTNGTTKPFYRPKIYDDKHSKLLFVVINVTMINNLRCEASNATSICLVSHRKIFVGNEAEVKWKIFWIQDFQSFVRVSTHKHTNYLNVYRLIYLIEF